MGGVYGRHEVCGAQLCLIGRPLLSGCYSKAMSAEQLRLKETFGLLLGISGRWLWSISIGAIPKLKGHSCLTGCGSSFWNCSAIFSR